MPRRGTYLVKKARSENWYLQLQYPVGDDMPKRVEKSLGTPDRLQAEGFAAQQIAEHKIWMATFAAWRRDNKIVRSQHGGHEVMPGARAEQDDGSVLSADEDSIYVVKHNAVISKRPNARSTSRSFINVIDDPELTRALEQNKKKAFPAVVAKTDMDAEIVESYIAERNLSKGDIATVRAALRDFKAITGGKLFQDSYLSDGKALAKFYFAKKNDKGGDREATNSYKTVEKKVGFLRAAVRTAMEDRKKYPQLEYNPFERVVKMPKPGEPGRPQDPFSLKEDEMDSMRPFVEQMRPDLKLLWTICAATGMRPSEVASIKTEETIEGLRCVTVGKKVKASIRTVPLPKCVLPLLPERITRPLFSRPHKKWVSKSTR